MNLKNYTLYFLYAFLAFPLSAMGVTYYVFMPSWYVSHYGASLAFLGTSIVLSRFWDAISDPIIGVISDKLIQLGYSRIVLIFFGVIILIPSFYILMNPTSLGNLNINWVFSIASFFFFLALTMISVPYEALGIEYSSDSVLRSKLIGSRDASFLFGTIGAVIFPYLIIDQQNEIKNSFINLSILYLLLIILALFFLVSKFYNKKVSEFNITQTSNFSKTTKQILLNNKNFQILLLAFVVSALGAALPASLFMFFAKYYLGMSEQEAMSSLLLYFIIGLIFLPLWIHLAFRFGKKRAWFFSQIINAGAFLPVYFLSQDTSSYFNWFIGVSALGMGGAVVLPSLIQADFINSEYNKNKVPIQGMVVGIWLIAKKFAQGLGSGASFFILAMFGFSQNSNDNLTALPLQTLAIFYCVIPSVLCLASIFVAINYKQED